MEEREQFIKWLKEICRWDRNDWFIKYIGEESSPGGKWNATVAFFTHNYKYTIRVKIRPDRTYLGCGVESRIPRAGETWTRGNDLSDGIFTRKTWENIKNDIIAYELVKVAKPVQKAIVTESPKTLVK